MIFDKTNKDFFKKKVMNSTRKTKSTTYHKVIQALSLQQSSHWGFLTPTLSIGACHRQQLILSDQWAYGRSSLWSLAKSLLNKENIKVQKWHKTIAQHPRRSITNTISSLCWSSGCAGHTRLVFLGILQVDLSKVRFSQNERVSFRNCATSW